MSLAFKFALPCMLFSAFSAGCSLSSGDNEEEQQQVKELRLVIEGPTSAAPGTATAGFRAVLTEGGTQAVENIFIALTPTSGVIDAPPDRPGTNGANSDATGRLQFALRPPSNITTAATITITGRADKDGKTAEATYQVAVTPDTFQFTQPSSGSITTVGTQNAAPLQFQWTRATGSGSEGVSGRVQLSTTQGAYFVVQGNALPVGQSVTVDTLASSSGGFAVPVAVARNSHGLVTFLAADALVAERRAEVVVQFVDTPASLNLAAQTLTVQASPSESRFSTVTAKVLNQGSEPVPGVQIQFNLKQATGTNVNERVFPRGGITGAEGTATSQYEAGPTGGKARIEACVVGTSICDMREITVEGGNGNNPDPTDPDPDPNPDPDPDPDPTDPDPDPIDPD